MIVQNRNSSTRENDLVNKCANYEYTWFKSKLWMCDQKGSVHLLQWYGRNKAFLASTVFPKW